MKRLQNELTVHTVEWIQWEVSPDKSYTLRAHSACHRNHFRGIVITRSSNRNDKNDNVCFVWGFKHILKEDLCASQWKVRWKLRACWHKRKRKKNRMSEVWRQGMKFEARTWGEELLCPSFRTETYKFCYFLHHLLLDVTVYSAWTVERICHSECCSRNKTNVKLSRNRKKNDKKIYLQMLLFLGFVQKPHKLFKRERERE